MTAEARNNGLTLVEVLVAVVLIAIVFAVLAATQVSSLRITRASQQGSEATQLAVDRLNQLTTIVLADYDGYQGCPDTSPVPGPNCSGSVVNGGYTAAHSISRGSGYQASGLIQISVDVTGPATASLASFVSCMDYSAEVSVDHDNDVATPEVLEAQTPTIRVPGVCAP